MHCHTLLVDDDPDHLELGVMALSAFCEPAAIATAGSGEQALSWLRAQPPEGLPRVVILDVKLGIESGFDVLRAIRAAPGLRHLPVVMHSSSRDAGDVALAYELGANAYVAKRSGFQELREVMGRIHGTWAASVLPSRPGAGPGATSVPAGARSR